MAKVKVNIETAYWLFRGTFDKDTGELEFNHGEAKRLRSFLENKSEYDQIKFQIKEVS